MTNKLKEIISENTGLSIGIVITICTGIFYISTLYARGESNREEIKEAKETIKETRSMQMEYNKDIKEINRRLGYIEGKLKIGE